MTEAASLDRYRCAVAALDQLERFCDDPSLGPVRQRLQHLLSEIRGRVGDMRDAIEDMLFADHGRLGFESECEREQPAESATVPPTRWSKLRPEDHEGIRHSNLSVKALAAQYGVSSSRIYEIRCGKARDRSSRGIM